MGRLNHLAIIPDGNRRWARKMNIFNEEEIYRKGAQRIKEIMEAVVESEIEFLTLWTSSLNNLKERSGKFYKAINRFYAKKFDELSKSKIFDEQNVKIQVVGEWKENLNDEAIVAIKKVVSATAENKKKPLQFLLAMMEQENGSWR
jgi:undecaprenyl diphosphate synthase